MLRDSCSGPSPAPPTGGLRVQCDLGRARVSIDYAYVGMTPLSREGLPPGLHALALTLRTPEEHTAETGK